MEIGVSCFDLVFIQHKLHVVIHSAFLHHKSLLFKPAFCLLFHLRLANKTSRYNHPLCPLNLTACLLNTSSVLREVSQFLFRFPSLSSLPVLLLCIALPPLHLPELLWPCLNPLNSHSTAVYPPGNTTDASTW